MYHSFLIHSSADGHLGCFHVMVVINSAVMNIEVQQNINLKKDVGVIIVNDGTNVHLSQELFDRYTFPIEYYLNEHNKENVLSITVKSSKFDTLQNAQ